MIHRYGVQIGVVLIAALLLIGSSTQAELVTVKNSSFESQTVENGAFTAPITDWTYWSSYYGAGGVANPTGYDAPENDTAYGFIGASGNETPLGGDGANVAWEYEYGSQYGMFQQVLDTPLLADHTYTFTAAVGMVPTDGNLGAQLILSIEDAPGSLTKLLTYADVTSSMIPAQFVNGSLTFTPTEAQVAAYSGQKLMLGLCGYSSGATGRIAFDTVRLDVVPPIVPEPSTFILLASGLLGLLACAWRKLR
jgi:hypothetical protein